MALAFGRGWFVRKDVPAVSADGIPDVVLLGDDFDLPTEVTDTQVVHGSGVVEAALLPLWKEIPAEFRIGEGRGVAKPWRKFQADWFYHGLSAGAVKARGGVDWDRAWRHLRAIQSSWEPTPEHKAAAVAWLAYRWFIFTPPVDVTADRVSYTGLNRLTGGGGGNGSRTHRR